MIEIYAERQRRLQALRDDKEALVAARVYYKTHPVQFINDWMVTYDPRLDTPYIPFVLFPKQEEYIAWLYERWQQKEDGLTEKSRDMGVTWLCCAFAAWMWLFHAGVSVAFGSRKEDLVDRLGDPDSIFEKIRIIIRSLPHEFIPLGYDEKKHAGYLKLLNPDNGSSIKGEAGDNIGRGGRSSIYFKDESAFYERPDKIEAALSMNSDVKIDVSTPNGNGNPFYRKRWSGKIPVFTFHWRDDPRKDENWYREQKNTLDPVIVAQEIDIDYNASVGNVLIKSEYVERAKAIRATEVEPYGPVVFGVDVARYGDDRSVIACRQGRVLHWIEIFNQLDTMEFAGIVKQRIDEYRPDRVFVDVVGIGAGVCDRLREWFPDIVIGVNAGAKSSADKYANKRTQMWGNMRDWFEDEPVSVPNHQDMVTDLCSLQYSFNSSGQQGLEQKEHAKKRGVRSPDIGDAIALTFSEPVEIYDWIDDEFRHDHGRSAVSGY